MKKILLLLAFFTFHFSLFTLHAQSMMFGHQDDTFYGIGWNARNGGKTNSDIKRVCGRYPAVMGFELSGIELGHERNIDGVPFTLMRQEIQKHIQRGGTVTLSWHPNNPVTGGNSWDTSDSTVVRAILPDGIKHQEFRKWIKNLCDFLGSLPKHEMIFRPWHENNGGWFWWGAPYCSPEEYKALWNMLQDEVIAQGFSNLVWSYSPNFDSNLTEEEFLTRYPGNDRVQLIGLDAYQDGGREDYQSLLNRNLNMLCQFASRYDRQVALTECGYRGGQPDPTWWTGSLWPVIKKYPLTYVLCWRNEDLNEHFGPYKNSPDSKDFKKFAKYVKLIK